MSAPVASLTDRADEIRSSFEEAVTKEKRPEMLVQTSSADAFVTTKTANLKSVRVLDLPRKVKGNNFSVLCSQTASPSTILEGNWLK